MDFHPHDPSLPGLVLSPDAARLGDEPAVRHGMPQMA
jgi:hypothetical protein